MNYIASVELKKRLDAGEAIVVLDIREPYEVEICEIGGIQIPMGEVVDRVNEIPRNQEIVVMCKSGRRAESVANLLCTDLEFTNVSILDGGIQSWIDNVDNSLEEY